MSAENNLAFIDSTYREAYRLTEEARDFFLIMDTKARTEHLSPGDVLLQSCEALRVTSRLTQVMAWLLVQKAIEKGEMSPEEASEPCHRLSHHDLCEQEETFFDGTVLPQLDDLLSRSLSLYQRIRRLDRLYDGNKEQRGLFDGC